jgi:hypothetical protein
MNEIEAAKVLAREFEMVWEDEGMELLWAFEQELVWERQRRDEEYQANRRPGKVRVGPATRERWAIDTTRMRLHGWLTTGIVLSESLLDHWIHGHKLGPEELVKELMRWVGGTRPPAVWCSLWWVKKKLEGRKVEGRDGHQKGQTSPAAGGDTGD